MSLGVLNNLSAMYAAHNLNNTNSALSKTLQQLSSGSKINSGSDDAAGLALVNGLQANATALAQSQTNAQEGVGLLQVADGALSQVTNLLNRAVTLATEVSNGTLNTSQQAAADQEYQSILSEIDNIGSTTSYNQRQVFNSSTSIYTGDSSTKGASIDALSIGKLDRTSVGQTNGSMSYTSGQSLFIDLSDSGVTNAQSTDNIAAGSTLNITYATGKDALGNLLTASATIKTGAGTTYANTVDGMISAINNSGLGISAKFGTATDAGVPGATLTANSELATDTGLILSGNVVNAAPAAVGEIQVAVGTLADSVTTGTSTIDAAAAGIATIGYTATNGANLQNTDLTSQANAQSVLNQLNNAIANVAAQDGYIGAQINTLNSVSNVMSTQQQNIVAAQDAVQATDYAQASSNMSKFQILSQTGIAALAQANSAQQEVLKLLQ
jgi:flagellin